MDEQKINEKSANKSIKSSGRPKKVVDLQCIPQTLSAEENIIIVKKRGRPKKVIEKNSIKKDKETDLQNKISPTPHGEGVRRGRPKKIKIENELQNTKEEPKNENLKVEEKIQKKRGRPKKV